MLADFLEYMLSPSRNSIYYFKHKLWTISLGPPSLAISAVGDSSQVLNGGMFSIPSYIWVKDLTALSNS